MVEHNFLDPEIIINSRLEYGLVSPYFIHLLPETMEDLQYCKFADQVQENYEELSKNDWALHKQLIREGVNQNEIARIIRNDEIEKLQEITSQSEFDFDQTIPKSLYERCSFINHKNVTLIDYAAFFGSIKCFKYLLMNGANVSNTGKYAVAGGNIEIIHLCEQNHSTFEDAYKTSIKFYKNDVFKYLYENQVEEINNIEEIGCHCIIYYNYEILRFLEEKGMKIQDDIINTSAKLGNIFLTKHFLQNYQIPKDILNYSIESDNIELEKYIIEQEGIDINAKDIYLFCMKFF